MAYSLQTSKRYFERASSRHAADDGIADESLREEDAIEYDSLRLVRHDSSDAALGSHLVLGAL